MPSASSDDPFLRNVSSISLGLGKSVQIITLIDKAYIVGVSESGVSLIDKIDDRELINAMNLYNDKHADVKKPRSFAEILDIFLPPKKKDTSSDESVFSSSTEEILEQLKNKRLNTEDK
nr:flagellar biosynthetic protein FliO [Treponema rectale]